MHTEKKLKKIIRYFYIEQNKRYWHLNKISAKIILLLLAICGDGGIGRHASLRGWFPQGSASSSLAGRTIYRFRIMVVQGTLTPLVVVQFHQPVPSVEAAYGVLPPTDLVRCLQGERFVTAWLSDTPGMLRLVSRWNLNAVYPWFDDSALPTVNEVELSRGRPPLRNICKKLKILV